MVYLGGFTQKLTALLSLLFVPLFFLMTIEFFGLRFPYVSYVFTDAVIVNGEVVSTDVSFVKDLTGNVQRLYYPTVRFKTKKGKFYTITDYTYDSSQKIKTGESVNILYYPDAPRQGYMFFMLESLVTTLAVLGAALLILRFLTGNLFFNPSPYE